jgi:hypothetical protein
VDPHINPADLHDLRDWACRLHVSPERLTELIGRLGPFPEQIRNELKRAELQHARGRSLKPVPGHSS